MIQTDVLVMLLHPGRNGTADLPNRPIDMTTFAGQAVHAWSLESQSVLHGPKETGRLLQRDTLRPDVVPAKHSTIEIESRGDKGKKGLLRGQGDILVDWEPSVLSVAKAVLPESGPEKL
jgi:hypothetical protein